MRPQPQSSRYRDLGGPPASAVLGGIGCKSDTRGCSPCGSVPPALSVRGAVLCAELAGHGLIQALAVGSFTRRITVLASEKAWGNNDSAVKCSCQYGNRNIEYTNFRVCDLLR